MLYQNAIEEEPNDKRALRCLSMVIRKLPYKSEKEKQKRLKQSIDFAKKAVSADIKDSENWYVLGNAHLTNFFMGGQLYDHLDFALKAYTQAEKSQVYQNPDLYYNRGTIYNYLERYSDAINDYEKAHSIDPNLGALDKAKAITEYVLNVCNLIKKKGALKSNKFIGLVKSVPKSIGEVKFLKKNLSEEIKEDEKKIEEDDKEEKKESSPIKYTVVTLKDWQRGINPGKVYIGKLICQLPRQEEVPVCFLMVDSKYEFSVLSIYNIQTGIENLKFGDVVMIRDPNLLYISIKFKKSLLSFPWVKITDILNILVNKMPLSESTYDPELVTETFS